MKMSHLVLLLCLIGVVNVNGCLETPEKEIKIEAGENRVVQAKLYDSVIDSSEKSINLVPEHVDIIAVTATTLKPDIMEVNISALSAGKSEILAMCGTLASQNDPEVLFMLVQVYYSKILEVISNIVGWLYFLSWSICFYPQLIDNYRKKSVVGLNFDTVMFGLVGYIMYNTFNVAMVYIPVIKRQYSQRYPKGIAPVLTNDLVFTMHGVAVTSATAYQCLIYHREKQTISTTATVLVALCFLAVGASIILALWGVIIWLDVVYLCSYIKLYGNITLYIPQVLMNYKRQSTTGFSIKGVLIDFTGGIFSMIQIFLDGYNYSIFLLVSCTYFNNVFTDDWKTIFENPTKFGIGVITLAITAVFVIQHYVLYPENKRKHSVELKSYP